ncbi:MAG: class I SAM-dependent rRNA methyltransferase [Acidobacteriota bacterium]|nr:class I SAM-dependent rRNA methyltransferase [Acidobacteriota bacterium]
MSVEANAAAAVATITRRAADRLRAGHLWIYRSDIERLSDGDPGGSLVSVVDARGIPLGTALFSGGSEIALRLISRQPGVSREQYLAELRTRVSAALQLRQQLVPQTFANSADNNACRLIFSEADDLPGIIADRYAGLVVVQLLTQGTAQDDVRRVLVDVLAEQIWVETIVERPDPRIRELEHLAAPPDAPLFVRGVAEASLQTVFSINSLSFHFDAASGQKTGAFLDQRLNYAAAASHSRGRALDVCTYQGGFALHLARACQRVTGVDASRAALEVADRNLELNSTLTAKVDWIEADAFELLRDFADAGERFDTIVLDPPAFAKTKRAAEGAMRGYKELNLRALKMLNSAGTLVTCSCSHHVGTEEFLEVVRASASDAGRRVQLLETRGAAPDHPAILTLPETSYLKCLILRVS